MPPFQHELTVARQVAQAAGQAILTFYDQPAEELHHKGVDDPQTAADRAANELIIGALAQAFPDDAILAEETAHQTTLADDVERLWLVDPLDGTKEFLERNGEFVVQIGLVVGGRPVLGVVYQPTTGRCDYGIVGQGAWRQQSESTPQPLHTRQVADPAQMVGVFSRSHRLALADAMVAALGLGQARALGSAGLKYGAIADGSVDLTFHATTAIKLWDTAAPEAILVAAGGQVSDLTGAPLRYDPGQLRHQNGQLASNGAAHQRLVEVLAPLWLGRTP
jgi:3'(2'), 5'-bisphosphate nucleotidase